MMTCLWMLRWKALMAGLDHWISQVQMYGYQLYNVNNLKLARFKEIFPAPAKSDPVDARKMLELFQLKESLPLAKGVLQAVLPVPEVNRCLKRLNPAQTPIGQREDHALQNRLQPDLQAICPALIEITWKCRQPVVSTLSYLSR